MTLHGTDRGETIDATPLVQILPMVNNDGGLSWRLPHWTSPFLRPRTIYAFLQVPPSDAPRLRMISAWIDGGARSGKRLRMES